MQQENIPLFPLSAHLLPGGRMSLRIFEPRYTRMVKEVCAKGTGFVLCMLNAHGDKEKNEHILPVGTYAEVIDFDMLEDGLLGIKVAGRYGVEITDISTEPDGLRVGTCETLEPWCCNISSEQIAPMDKRLKEVFERYSDIGALYESPQFNDPLWVLHRWLELLPVDAKQKQHLLLQKDCRKLLNYLAALVE